MPFVLQVRKLRPSAVKLLAQSHKLAVAKPELKLETRVLEEASFIKRKLTLSCAVHGRTGTCGIHVVLPSGLLTSFFFNVHLKVCPLDSWPWATTHSQRYKLSQATCNVESKGLIFKTEGMMKNLDIFTAAQGIYKSQCIFSQLSWGEGSGVHLSCYRLCPDPAVS